MSFKKGDKVYYTGRIKPPYISAVVKRVGRGDFRLGQIMITGDGVPYISEWVHVRSCILQTEELSCMVAEIEKLGKSVEVETTYTSDSCIACGETFTTGNPCIAEVLYKKGWREVVGRKFFDAIGICCPDCIEAKDY